jgi:shikimate kinase
VLIEFAGCSGAGKSTIAGGVANRLRSAGVPVHEHAVLSSSALVTLRNGAVATMALARLLANRGDPLSYARVVFDAIRRRNLSRFWTFARSAAAARIIDAHVNRQRRTTDAIADVVDEGILTTISLAFASGARATASEMNEIVERMPLPDVVVWVDAPLEDLVYRTRRRTDIPRELRGMSEQQLESWFESSKRAFEHVLSAARISPSVVSMWNPNRDRAALDADLDQMARTVHQKIRLWQPCSPRR